MSHFVLKGTIKGHLPSGKNNYRLSQSRMYRTAEVMSYERDFIYQAYLLKIKNKIKEPIDKECLVLIAKVFFDSWKRDVDTILFCDLLQKAGIIKNDRMIRMKFIDGTKIDKDNPRVEFELRALNENDEICQHFTRLES